MNHIDNIITLTFRVYTQAPGSHIVVCQNCPIIIFRCTNVADCIDKAKEKVQFYISKGKNLLNHIETKEQMTSQDVWQFNLIYNTKNKSFKVEKAGILIM